MTECVLVPHQSKHTPSTVSPHQHYNYNLIIKVLSTLCRHAEAEHFPNISSFPFLSSVTLQSLISTFPSFLTPLPFPRFLQILYFSVLSIFISTTLLFPPHDSLLSYHFVSLYSRLLSFILSLFFKNLFTLAFHSSCLSVLPILLSSVTRLMCP